MSFQSVHYERLKDDYRKLKGMYRETHQEANQFKVKLDIALEALDNFAAGTDNNAAMFASSVLAKIKEIK